MLKDTPTPTNNAPDLISKLMTVAFDSMNMGSHIPVGESRYVLADGTTYTKEEWDKISSDHNQCVAEIKHEASQAWDFQANLNMDELAQQVRQSIPTPTVDAEVTHSDDISLKMTVTITGPTTRHAE